MMMAADKNFKSFSTHSVKDRHRFHCNDPGQDQVDAIAEQGKKDHSKMIIARYGFNNLEMSEIVTCLREGQLSHRCPSLFEMQN